MKKINVLLLAILALVSCNQEDYMKSPNNDYIDIDTKLVTSNLLYENQQLFELYLQAHSRFLNNVVTNGEILFFKGNEAELNISPQLFDFFESSLKTTNNEILEGKIILIVKENNRFELISSDSAISSSLKIKTRSEGGGGEFTPINLDGPAQNVGTSILKVLKYYDSDSNNRPGNLSHLVNLNSTGWNQQTVKNGMFYYQGVPVYYSVQNKNAHMNYSNNNYDYNMLCGPQVQYNYNCYSVGIRSCYDHTNVIRVWTYDRNTMTNIRQNIGW